MKFIITAHLALLSFCLHAQTLVSKTLIASYSKQQLDSLLTARGIPAILFSTRYGVDAYKLIYRTLDYDSSAKLASGLLAVPKGVNCELMLVNYSHGTTSVKEDVPTRLNGEGLVGLVAASNGLVMCEPDYLGMGDSEWPHYYLHAFTQAMCNIDLLRATREACAELDIALNDKLYIGGYSQGGFSAMATHQYIETYFPSEFQVTKSFPGAGSYDMSGAMVDLMLSDLSYPSPAYLPFLAFTWNVIYRFFTDPSVYLKAPYDSTLPPLIDGTHSIGYINGFMPDTPKLIFHQHMIDSFAGNMNHPLRLALAGNDVFRWVPRADMLLIHCRGDRQVPIQNTRNAYNYFKAHSSAAIDTLDLGPTLSHGQCGQSYLFYLKNYLDSILAGEPCISGLSQPPQPLAMDISPNPATGRISFRLPQPAGTDYEWRIYGTSGKAYLQGMIHHAEMNQQPSISTESLQPGMYLLQIASRHDLGRGRFVIVR